MKMSRKKLILLLGLLTVLLHIAFIVIDGLISTPEIADVIVILGNKVNPDGQPSARLKSRLDKGAALFLSGYGKKIIVSGGLGKEGFDEAVVMAHYLREQGIDSSRIIVDSKGNTTFLTARNTAVILEQNRYTSAIVVSQYYHLSRTKLAFRKVGIQQVSAASCAIIEWRDLYAIPREAVGLYTYSFRKNEY